MRRLIVVLAALALVAQACDRLPFASGGGEERTVLVDYSHDEFASFYLYNFPKKIEITPGMSVVFRQTWTGEPHTVTGGSDVSKGLKSGTVWIEFFEAFDALASTGADIPNPEDPGDATFQDFVQGLKSAKDKAARKKAIDAYEALVKNDKPVPDLDSGSKMPFTELVETIESESDKDLNVYSAFTEEGEDISQNIGQPCYLDTGKPPKDSDTSCKNAQQEQPDFNGKQSFYNSGIIPYEGAQGNTFKIPFSDDIKPGSYLFFCAVHGPLQTTEVVVRPDGSDIPSQEDVSKQAAKEIAPISDVLENVHRTALKDNTIELEGEKVRGPFAGLFAAGEDHAAINEFVPKNRTVKAGEPITWKMMGADHTVTFDVPTYFPIMQFRKNGTIRLNPKLNDAAGGAKKKPEQEGMGVLEYDAGTYDGSGFWSTGLVGAEPYLELTMRISKPGTYEYACLLHPPMVGKIEVT